MTTFPNIAHGGRALAASLLMVTVIGSGSPALAAEPVQAAPAPAAAKPGLNLNMGMSQIDKMLDKVNATPDQRSKIKAILFDAFSSMGSIAPEVKTTAAAFKQSLMSSPRVNKAQLESARLSAVADFDAFSKVMVKAIGDAADVLTPEQRAKLAPAPNPKS